jgi:hypothetical protein
MAVASTPAYYDMATIATVKCFVVQASDESIIEPK